MSNNFATPLSPEQSELFGQLTGSLNVVQLAWISGYLAAITAQNGVQTSIPVKIEINEKLIIVIVRGILFCNLTVSMNPLMEELNNGSNALFCCVARLYNLDVSFVVAK